MTEPAAPANATEAQTRLTSLVANKEWGAKIEAGDVAAKREMRELTAMIAAGGDDVAAAIVGGDQLPGSATTDQRHMAGAAEMFRELGIRTEVTQQFLSGHQVSAKEFELVSNWKKLQMRDAEWVKLYLSGDLKAQHQMTLANSVIANGVKSA
jgi:hypothetical protein